nr:MAG: hypothetical protein DIU55_03030 [Bacillota bacterium]
MKRLFSLLLALALAATVAATGLAGGGSGDASGSGQVGEQTGVSDQQKRLVTFPVIVGAVVGVGTVALLRRRNRIS